MLKKTGGGFDNHYGLRPANLVDGNMDRDMGNGKSCFHVNNITPPLGTTGSLTYKIGQLMEVTRVELLTRFSSHREEVGSYLSAFDFPVS